MPGSGGDPADGRILFTITEYRPGSGRAEVAVGSALEGGASYKGVARVESELISRGLSPRPQGIWQTRAGDRLPQYRVPDDALSPRIAAWVLFVLAGISVAYVVFALLNPWPGEYLGLALLIAVVAVIVGIRLLRGGVRSPK